MALPSLHSEVREEDLTSYDIDGIIPKAVVLPESVEGLSSILKTANKEGVTIIPRGSGTKMTMGNILKRLDVIISSLRLNRIIECEPSDLNLTAESGVRLWELQREVAKKGQFLPFDPPFSSLATLGGIVAANSNGPRRLRYGSIRDNLTGIKVVHADGRMTRSGGKVVKNVAGYDMKKLYIGSLGTLAFISEMTFRTYPIPEKVVTLVAQYFSSKDAFNSGLSLLRSFFLPSGLEFLDKEFVEVLKKRAKFLEGLFGPLLVARFEGVPVDVDRQARSAVDLFKKNNTGSVEVLEGREENELWLSMMDFSKVLRAETGGAVVIKAGHLMSGCEDVMERTRKIAEDNGLKLAYHSHIGLGISKIYGTLDEDEKWVKAVSELRDYLEGSSGYLVIEDCSPGLKGMVDVWGTPRGDLRLMRAIKSKLDPKSILSPGRFLGGI